MKLRKSNNGGAQGVVHIISRLILGIID